MCFRGTETRNTLSGIPASFSAIACLKRPDSILRRLRHQNRRAALRSAGSQVVERIVGACKRVNMGRCSHARALREAEKFKPVMTGQVGDRQDFPLLPHQAVWKLCNVAIPPQRVPRCRTFRPLALAQWQSAGRKSVRQGLA